MAHISKRSLKASKQGVQLASCAILRFPTKIDFAAELEISRSTVQNFFAGKPVGRENFHKICQELDLAWQEVAELPSQLSKLEVSSNNNSISIPVDPSVDFSISGLRQLVRSRIISMCGMMRILDMSCPKLTEDIYVETKVCEKIQGRRRLGVNRISSSSITDSDEGFEFPLDKENNLLQKISGWDASSSYSKLIVLGKPGAGKTMLLKYLTLECIKGTFKPQLVPIFVSVRDFVAYKSSFNLVDYIANQLIQDGQPLEISKIKQLLNQGKFFIVLDGLDEVQISVRASICQYLRRFTEWFPQNHYIISCRHGVQYCNLEQFTEVEIADFQPEQIQDFVTKWFITQEKNQSSLFINQLRENNLIQDFATNPLLLTLFCILFAEVTNFPSSSGEICEECLEIMLRQWDLERGINREAEEGLTWEQKKDLLRSIACKTFENREYFLPEAKLKSYIADYTANLPQTDLMTFDTYKILKSLEAKHGLLVEQAKKIYSFSHLAFQEYLTAQEFTLAKNITTNTQALDSLLSHVMEARWRTIFLLIAEISFQTDTLLLAISRYLDGMIVASTSTQDFLAWVNCKTKSIITQKSQDCLHFNQITEFQLATIRAFYFCLGCEGILGETKHNFSLASDIDPNFRNKIDSNLDLCLDFSLFNLFRIIPKLESIQSPGFTLQRSLNRAILCADKIEPDLAKELKALENIFPPPEVNSTQFWLWWHQQGKSWSGKLRSITVKYRNVAHKWRFNSQQRKALKHYYRLNSLLLDCLHSSSYPATKVKQQIEQLLLPPSEIETVISPEMELMLQPSIA